VPGSSERETCVGYESKDQFQKERWRRSRIGNQEEEGIPGNRTAGTKPDYTTVPRA
jgi:hypothetical protein